MPRPDGAGPSFDSSAPGRISGGPLQRWGGPFLSSACRCPERSRSLSALQCPSMPFVAGRAAEVESEVDATQRPLLAAYPVPVGLPLAAIAPNVSVPSTYCYCRDRRPPMISGTREMFCLLAVLGAASCSTLPLLAQLPSPPAAVHPVKPTSRTVTTDYICSDGKRSLVLRYDKSASGRFSSAIRNGVAAGEAVIKEMNRFLTSLDHVQFVHPDCHETSDLLHVSGIADRKKVRGILSWNAEKAIAISLPAEVSEGSSFVQ
jgi:hypothetical protein